MKLIPEWHEHQYCLIAWPCNKDLYGKIINKARDEVANVINEIAKTEHVIVLSNKEDINEIQNKTDHKNIDILECKLDDSWMRDIAPIFYNENEKLKSISFEFNGYGKYPDYLNDNKISKFISNYLNIPTKISDIVIEGGAITYDDRKNLISEIKPFDLKNLIEWKVVQGGMIPKIKNCVDAVENGVRGVVILDGRRPHSILHEIFSDTGSGTLIRE